MNDNLLKRNIIIIVGICLFIFVGSYFLYTYYKDMKKETEEIILKKQTNTEVLDLKTKEKEEKIKVDIKGEIKKPNIYSASLDDRVIDIITKAGGLTKDADTSLLNLSKKVKDEMVIIIYSKKQVKNYEQTKQLEIEKKELCNQEVKNDACIEEKDKIQGDDSMTNQTGPININTSTIEQLQTLPGLGENKAKSIIRYREEHGGFKTIEEIKNVNGIGDSIFDKIKNLITI